jgi:pyruvate/2-oxoglutarate/acetoin dehydrogenase E1 component
MRFPITVRMPYGGGVRAPELHDDSPEAYYVHTPGVKVAIPSTPADAKGLLAAAIRSDDPVVLFEPKLHYRTMRGEVPDGEHVVELGKARLAREGEDLSVITYGAMVHTALEATEDLEGASIEVLDLRTLVPLDTAAILESVRKTSKVLVLQEASQSCGVAAEVSALIGEHAWEDLDGPIRRLTTPDVPVPFSPPLERAVLPQVDDVREACRELLEY